MVGLGDLPPEIRACIWSFCLPGPRNVSIRYCSHTPAPVVFHICSESRAEAQNSSSYELAFPASFRTKFEMGGRPVVWFDFSKDRLCLERDTKPISCLDNFRRVRSLGLQYWDTPQDPEYLRWLYMGDVSDYFRKRKDIYVGVKEVVFFLPPQRVTLLEGNAVMAEPLGDHKVDDEFREYTTRALMELYAQILSEGGSILDNQILPPFKWHMCYDMEFPFDDPSTAPDAEDSAVYVYLCATSRYLEYTKVSRDQLGLSQEGNPDFKWGFKGCPQHKWEGEGFDL
ncbi:hypothetical protein GGR54DRAFT_19121 [Hypoxylon sp. NC1633]|nr:hypothetical protein GGR54DRAFT_19121 [Hypoxylon sp. NC1633]